MPLLTFDRFEAALPGLLAEAQRRRGALIFYRDHERPSVASALGQLIQTLARTRGPLELPGRPIALLDGGTLTVRDEVLRALAEALEVLARLRQRIEEDRAVAFCGVYVELLMRCAFETFAAPGGELPYPPLTWESALEQAGVAVGYLHNPAL
jgi:hypothetical protein